MKKTILALLGVSAFLISACGSADDTHDEAKAESVCLSGIKDKAGPIGDIAVADVVTVAGNDGSFSIRGKLTGSLDSGAAVAYDVSCIAKVDGKSLVSSEVSYVSSTSPDASGAPTTSAKPKSATPALPTIGQPVTSGGAIVTINSVVESQSITAQPERSITRGEYAEQAPRSGGKFVIVDTTVLNDGKVSMDLTCSFPIQNKLITADKRQYDPIDDLYKIQGNPECNDGLQPGFDSHMVYVYEIPTAAVPAQFGFADMETQTYNNLTLINVANAG
ncbi:hypothetical protein AN948_06445 [Rhodococcus sp. ADH]|uniref:DUF4352 domain-containing protein n=1 Tax=unclassified Rhodococcus (in: high G+C Gram-positive bacteria) TaxID=192944 RepID=UPI0006BA152E|nr:MULTISPECIES: DUF4352 domain-containing protein [unclassified Rhodococcus (in: high G+C Gram-positive bacteria)]KPH20504.1 hypothetical protein AN948_06445 [Rhodococcus sp. ADH]RGP44664.1 hypothetical protein AWH04_03195 [Rhodococcus erythropolis]